LNKREWITLSDPFSPVHSDPRPIFQFIMTSILQLVYLIELQIAL